MKKGSGIKEEKNPTRKKKRKKTLIQTHINTTSEHKRKF